MSTPLNGVRKKLIREGCCRLCPEEDVTRHHLVPISWFVKNPGSRGRHHTANIVPLCRFCHDLVDGIRASPLRVEKRRALRATLTENEVGFIRKIRGDDWLDHHYPLATENHASAA